jgi:ammonia channel protein AmtB
MSIVLVLLLVKIELMILSYSWFYSGLLRRKSALSLIWLSPISASIISFQWCLRGYSVAFSNEVGSSIGEICYLYQGWLCESISGLLFCRIMLIFWLLNNIVISLLHTRLVMIFRLQASHDDLPNCMEGVTRKVNPKLVKRMNG